MGQYFIAVNEDKKEFIHPHTKLENIIWDLEGFVYLVA